jgi:hypothetical protein
MTSRPPDLRLDDLSEPRIDSEVRVLMDAVIDMAGTVELSRDAIMARAREETGLEDFGDTDALDRLGLITSALGDVALSAFGRTSMFLMLTQMAKNRLLIEQTLARHPEIHDVEIAAPIIIAGLQRSGTTHLHNLLSADTNLRHLPYWESLEPVLPDAEREQAAPEDPRIARCAMALEFQHAAMPHFNRMHEMTVEHSHEEIQLIANNFSSMLFEAIVPLPAFRDHYKAVDQTSDYEYLKTVLKLLTWNGTAPSASNAGQASQAASASNASKIGKTNKIRWVLKSPQHLEQFGPLTKVFPDATFVLTHRDPVSVIASVATMNAYSLRMHEDRIDVDAVGRYWAERTEDMLRACVRDRALLPAERSIDIPFHEYMRSDMAAVRRIYELARQPLEADVLQAMDDYQSAHPRGRHGRIAYKLSDFGLDGHRLRERLSFYTQRFGLDHENAAL